MPRKTAHPVEPAPAPVSAPVQAPMPAPAPAPVAAPAPAPKPAAPKKAFGGYAVSFAGRKETLEHVFGSTPLPPSEMTKKLWSFVKENKLSVKV